MWREKGVGLGNSGACGGRGEGVVEKHTKSSGTLIRILTEFLIE